MIRAAVRAAVIGGALLVGPFGACTAIVDPDRSRLDPPPDCTTSEECDNGRWCDGQEQCLARTCIPGDDPCLDGVSCTIDDCIEEDQACEYEEDDSQCPQDPLRQRCDLVAGCVPLAGC